MNIDISAIGYQWKGIYSEYSAYKERDVVYKNGGAYVIRNGTPQPFALGQQDVILKNHLLTGGVSVGGMSDTVLHSNGSGGVEFRFMGERNGTLATKLLNTDIGGQYAGHRFGMGAIMNEGAVRFWGQQTNGQGGSGSQDIDRVMPALAAFPPGTPRIVSMQTGYDCVFFIDASGGLWHAGANSNGGSGMGSESPLPRKLNGTGDIPASAKITKVFCGLGWYDYRQFGCIDDTGKVYTWSTSNRYNALGHQTGTGTPKLVPFTTTNPIKDVYMSAGYYCATFFLGTDGRLWSCGQGGTSGLSVDDQVPRLFMPWGENNTVKCVRVHETVYSAAPADYYRKIAVVLDNGDMYMWGDDSGSVSGGWGTGANVGTDIWTTSSLFPYKVLTNVADCYVFSGGYSRSIALMKDGTVKHSGYNGFQIGDGVDRTSWTTIGGAYLQNVTKLRVRGGDYGTSAMALRSDGKAVGWGRNDYGQCGKGHQTDGTAPDGFVLLDKNIIDFQMSGYINAAAGNHAYHFLTSEGKVYSCGASARLQTQDRVGNIRTTPHQIVF
jgi:alpha-tubulin suppressor-like RCC1 family protein